MSAIGGRILQSSALNWAANYINPRNVGGLLGYRAMAATIEIIWKRQLRARDLTAIISDHFVQTGATVVDVGASWGLFSYHLAERVGERGFVYSYEPHPANANVLQNLASARSNVIYRQFAVSDANGGADMFVPRKNGRGVTAQSSLAHGFSGVSVDALKVTTVRLDDQIDEHQRIDFVKIDVEGHEQAVLRGAASVLRRHSPSMLIEIEQRHLTAPISEVFDQLESFGYHVFYITGPTLRPVAEFDVQRDQLSKVTSDKFIPFSMPKDYVCNFCAVRDPGLLPGMRFSDGSAPG
jgi:FkbM family methyltransferase